MSSIDPTTSPSTAVITSPKTESLNDLKGVRPASWAGLSFQTVPIAIPFSIPRVDAWADGIAEREKLSPLAGCWYSEIGDLNRFVHLWAYRSFDERARVRREARERGIWPPPMRRGPGEAGEQAHAPLRLLTHAVIATALRRPHKGMKTAAALPIVIPAPQARNPGTGDADPRVRCKDEGTLQGSLKRRSAGGVGPLAPV